MVNLKWNVVIHTLEGDERTIAAFDISSEAIKYANDYVNVWRCTHITVAGDEIIHTVKRTKPNVT